MTVEIDLTDLFILKNRELLRRRTPNGERMTQFRWLVDGPTDTVWLFSSGLVSRVGVIARGHESRWQAPRVPQPVVFGFWLATAARQDLWRSLKGVPGLMPVLKVTPTPENRAVSMMLGAVLPPKRMSHAVDAVLEDLFQPRRLNAWTEWAHRRTAAWAAANGGGKAAPSQPASQPASPQPASPLPAQES